ncbi:hypothetical protein DCC79_00865 [bacterium]|nr:hypothetical protein [Chloroflexi bacterium CFX6]RIL12627.1 MAG: hypothetical protein DCC79_00865 [bacterium]
MLSMTDVTRPDRAPPTRPARRPYHSPTVLDLAHASLRENGRLRLRVVGHSMAPLLHDGDLVWVEPMPAKRLQCGDLVLVRLAEDLLTHRLIAVDSQGWHTKGDNVGEADPPVAAAAILGKVVSAERRGRMLDFRQTRWTMANRLVGASSSLERRLGARAEGPAARLARLSAGVLRRLTRQLVRLPTLRPVR